MKRLPFISGAVAALSMACLSLGGCATAPSLKVDATPTVITVEKPVPVSCVDPAFPAAPPAFPDTTDARLHVNTPAEDYNLLAAGAPLHTAWEASLLAQVQACR
jgi:hypothetical protein